MDKLFEIIFPRLFLRFPVLKQFAKFAMVGAVNAIIDFLVYYFLTRSFAWFNLHYLTANALAFSAAVTSSFFLNNRFTFYSPENRANAHSYFKFFAFNLLTLLIVEACFYFLVGYLGVYDIVAKYLLLVLSGISNFTFSRIWVFKKTN
ncbi:MAG: GtrA family protein [Patescibacteria group bacterium]|jgi:putative flippase GtrA